MTNILVLGCEGFIGHNLVNSLQQRYHVVGYDRPPKDNLMPKERLILFMEIFARKISLKKY